jgi:transposase-like protein
LAQPFTRIAGAGKELDMPYSEVFKRKMVQRMCGPEALSATALAKQVDVPQTTLSKWLRLAGQKPAYVYPNDPNRCVPVNAMKPRRPEEWPAEEKLKTVLEAQGLSDEQLGIFLRQKGLHETHLERWRQQMIEGLQPKAPAKKSQSHPGDLKRIRALEQELRRKDKALAETAALLVLKKKVQEIWGDADEHTTGNNGK